MTRASRTMCGVLLILVPAVEFGGWILLRQVVNPASPYMTQPMHQNLERAAHAHAGVILLLSLVMQLLADYAVLPGALVWTVRIAFPVAAALMSAGFFLGVVNPALLGIVYAGGGVLALSVFTLAVGLLRPPESAGGGLKDPS